MQELYWALGASIVVSLLSFIGILTLFFNDKVLKKITLPLVGLSAGALIGGAFLHLIPESAEEIGIELTSLYILVGLIAFFLIERVLHWHHCHVHGDCEVHTFHKMNLIGDSVHNLFDGIIIAGSFLISIPVGIASTIAIITHEIPQEIGDFGVLLHAGWKKTKALFFNFLTALTAVLGTIIGFFLADYSNAFLNFVIPFAAGGFIYIGASDLIPELHKEARLKKSISSILLFLTGITLMLLIKIIFEG